MLLSLLLVLAQSQAVLPLPSAPPPSPPPSLKNAPELIIDDARAVLELQRKQLYQWNEHHRLKAESLEREKAAVAADREMDVLLQQLRDKYTCPRCDLLFDMKWRHPPPGPQLLPMTGDTTWDVKTNPPGGQVSQAPPAPQPERNK